MKRIILLLLFAMRCWAQVTVPPVTAECATSVDGSVVSVQNPVNPPILAPGFTGTLPAGNYFVQIVWYDASNNLTLPSPEVQIQLTGSGEILVSPPQSGMPANAAGTQVFIGQTSGSETLQGTIAGSATYVQSVPLVTGVSVPTVNNTVCQIIANDAGWPTGTGYVVGVTSAAGATLPGYPQQWQLLGPGNTINISQGLPLYNGTVTYPVPLLARPYGHGPQSISGPLSMGGYNITSVGALGVGTVAPGWGIDVEGTSPAPIPITSVGCLPSGIVVCSVNLSMPTAGIKVGDTFSISGNSTAIFNTTGYIVGSVTSNLIGFTAGGAYRGLNGVGGNLNDSSIPASASGAINAYSGYLLNGLAPLNHILLGNGTYYVDAALPPTNVIFYTGTGGASNLPFAVVQFQITLSGGSASYTLTGNAAYAAPPNCWGNDLTGTHAVSVIANSGTSLTINGSANDVVEVFCMTPARIF